MEHRVDQPPSRADVVIVGAGHNGLAAAGYLARGGHDVVVLEASPTIGGMTSSSPLVPTAPHHTMHPCAGDIIMMRGTPVAEELELERYGLRTVDPDPPYAYLGPDGETLAFWRDPDRTAEEIARFSTRDADAYLELVGVLKALVGMALPMMRTSPVRPATSELARATAVMARNPRRLRHVGALAVSSAEHSISERFSHPVVRGALMVLAAGAGPTDADGSALGLILLGLLHAVGIGRPVGGMQQLTNAMGASARAHGARIVTDAIVSEIVVRDGRVVGVRAAGFEIATSAVLATCDPHTALRRLITPGVLDHRMAARVAAIPANARGAGVMIINLALGRQVQMPRHEHPETDLRVPVTLYGTAEDVAKSFISARRGEVPAAPFLWVLVATACDPTQAPLGEDVVYLYSGAMPAHPAGGWAAHKAEATEATMSRVGEILGSPDVGEIGRWVETPAELAERTGARNGCTTHVDFSLTRSGPLRPALGLGGYRTPIDGLFLGGAGSHPGGGVSGLPGRISSAVVHRYLAASRDRSASSARGGSRR